MAVLSTQHMPQLAQATCNASGSREEHHPHQQIRTQTGPGCLSKLRGSFLAGCGSANLCLGKARKGYVFP